LTVRDVAAYRLFGVSQCGKRLRKIKLSHFARDTPQKVTFGHEFINFTLNKYGMSAASHACCPLVSPGEFADEIDGQRNNRLIIIHNY